MPDFQKKKGVSSRKVIHTTNNEELRNSKDTVRQYTTLYRGNVLHVSAVQGSSNLAVYFKDNNNKNNCLSVAIGLKVKSCGRDLNF